ncbi:hypothetical protein ACFL6X_04750 [Candidatus Latescibacterota bacterium]
MDYVMNIGKLLAIFAALIALRFFIQAVTKGRGCEQPGASRLSFVVAPLITGGPMFIAIPASMYALKEPSAPSFFALAAWGGALGLAIGLVIMFRTLMRQQQDILTLQELLADQSAGDAKQGRT